MKPIAIIVISVAFLGARSSFGSDVPKANPFNQVLAAVPAAELPAKAADLVLHSKGRDRQTATVNVVKCAVGMNPAAAPAIVGAIARAVPDMASVAAGAAAAQQPKQASAIAKAAAAAAPSKAGKIVTAVCRAVPNEYRNVAVAVSRVVPDARKAILKAVATALPVLEPGIESTVAGDSGNVLSVGDTLDQAASAFRISGGSGGSSAAGATLAPVTAPALTPMIGGPAVGPPYHPLTTTPTNVTSRGSGTVPVGGRNYASP